MIRGYSTLIGQCSGLAQLLRAPVGKTNWRTYPLLSITNRTDHEAVITSHERKESQA
jgi:hypothetical protein